MKRYASFALLAFALPLAAQKPKPTIPPPPPPPVVTPATPVPDTNLPNMTELQQAQLDRDLAKIDAAQSRAQAQAQAESLQWADDAQRIINEVQKANPEFIWHVAQGPGDRTGWAHKPKPAPPVTPPAPVAPAPTTPPAK